MSTVRRCTSHEPYSPDVPLNVTATQEQVANFSEVEKEARTGRGYIIYPNGTIYEGEWQRGERHGLGVCYYESGNIYVGQFNSGAMEGEGTMFFASGNFFTGEFRNSLMHRGVFSAGGKEVRGVWEKGVQVRSEPIDVPQNLKRAHVALFTRIVNRVHEHFRCYGREEGGLSAPVPLPPCGSFFSPPLDTFSQGSSPMLEELTRSSSRRGGGGDGVTAVPPLPRSLRAGLAGGNPHFPIAAAAPQGTAMGAGATTAAVPFDGMSVASERVRPPLSLHDGADPVKEDLRTAMTQPSSPEAIFVGASPNSNENFSLARFELRLFVYLFPFLSLPGVSFAPLRITSLEEEREFVVSGGTLGREFDTPGASLLIVAVAMCCQIASIVLVAFKVTLGYSQNGQLTLPEMVIPCVLWLTVALFCASYHSYYHVPHALERMNRKLTPKLAAFAASVVDARSTVCIYTWDDEGRGKVRNRHYRYRWVGISVIFGAMMSLSAPATRAGQGHGMFGTNGFELAAALLAFFATFCFSSVLTYYVMKLTDMQREVNAKLHVLGELAFIENRSITAPSSHLRQPFELDHPFDPSNLFKGFPGWYAARSIVLYASACANHCARSAAMSIFMLAVFFASVVALSAVFKDLAEDRLRSNMYYSTAHSYGLFVLFFWGLLLFRYFYVCGATNRELATHQFVMDTAALYQRVCLDDRDASETIELCRSVAARHDAVPSFFQGKLMSLMSVVIVSLNVAGLAAIVFELAEVIYY